MNIEKWKRPLIAILVISVLLTLGVGIATSDTLGSSVARLILTFDGIGEGFDPKGERFNINELKSVPVLEAALAKLHPDGGGDVEALRKSISITPVTKRDALLQLVTVTSVSGKTEDVTDQFIHPNEYIIKAKGASSATLAAVMEAYQEFFKNKYIAGIGSDAVYTEEKIAGLDYPEMIMILYQNAESLVRYAGVFEQHHQDFVSPARGISFNDLYEQAKLIRDVDVANLRSMSKYFALTKNVSERIKYEEIVLKRARLAHSKAVRKETSVGDILGIYDNFSNFIFLQGESINVDPSKRTYYGSLMEESILSKSDTIDASYRVAEIIETLDRMENHLLPAHEYIKRAAELEEGVQLTSDRIKEIRVSVQKLAVENYDLHVGNKIAVESYNSRVFSIKLFIVFFALLSGLWYAATADPERRKRLWEKYEGSKLSQN